MTRVQGIFQGLEINADTKVVKRRASDDYPHAPVMAMNVFAGAVIMYQMMRRRKMRFRRYFEHT